MNSQYLQEEAQRRQPDQCIGLALAIAGLGIIITAKGPVAFEGLDHCLHQARQQLGGFGALAIAYQPFAHQGVPGQVDA